MNLKVRVKITLNEKNSFWKVPVESFHFPQILLMRNIACLYNFKGSWKFLHIAIDKPIQGLLTL
jgi:hypothetical protein